MFKDIFKNYKVEIIAGAITIINSVLIGKNLLEIKEMKEHPKIVIFDK